MNLQSAVDKREAALRGRMKKVYGTPSQIWDATGPNGIQYPSSISTIRNSTERLIAEADYDNDIAMQISHAIRDSDSALLGSLILANAKPYLDGIAEDLD